MVWKWLGKGSLVALALMAVTPSYGVPIATYDANAGGLFVSQTDVNHIGPGSGTDLIQININSLALVSPGAAAVVTLAFTTSIFSSLTVDWDGGPASVVTPGTQVNIPLTFVGLGTHYLNINWAIAGATNARYSYALSISPVPLPPAVLLFLSALAGIGFLARRRGKAQMLPMQS